MEEFNEIYQYIDRHFDEHVERLKEFLRQPGVSLTEPLYTSEGVRKSCEMLCNYYRVLGSTTEKAYPLETDGYPVAYGIARSKNKNAKTIILYSLYDVMPADEPGWVAPPFAAEILDAEKIGLPKHFGKCIVSRGARNQRGPTIGFINALESMLKVTGDIPVNVIFFVEGEEELASPHMKQARDKVLDELKEADAAYYPNLLQEVQGLRPNEARVFLGYRGVIFLELECKGGDWGGPKRALGPGNDRWIDAPSWNLLWALNTIKGRDGRILIDGFYDDVRPIGDEEREMLKILMNKFDDAGVKRMLDINQFKWSLSGKDLYEDFLMAPSINIDGYSCGYTGPGVKSGFPANGKVKMDIRLVPNMDRDDILKKLRMHLNSHGFPHIDVRVQAGYGWTRTSIKEPIAQACVQAIKTHGVEPICYPIYSGSTPQVVFTEPPLNLPTVTGGIGRAERSHEANEFITIDGLRDFEKFVVTFLNLYARM